MLTIRREQMDALNREMTRRFVVKSVEFLRSNYSDWAEDKGEEEIRRFISTMINVAFDHNIRKEINIQKLLDYKIQYCFAIPLPPYLQSSLDIDGMNEESRIELFEEALLSGKGFVETSIGDGR